jgi:hypothetical protein
MISLSGSFESSASNLYQSPEHPGLFVIFLQGHQVLNLKEGHQ